LGQMPTGVVDVYTWWMYTRGGCIYAYIYIIHTYICIRTRIYIQHICGGCIYVVHVHTDVYICGACIYGCMYVADVYTDIYMWWMCVRVYVLIRVAYCIIAHIHVSLCVRKSCRKSPIKETIFCKKDL